MEEKGHSVEDEIHSAALQPASAVSLGANDGTGVDSIQEWFGRSKVCDVAGHPMVAVRDESSLAKWFPEGTSRVFREVGDWYGTNSSSSQVAPYVSELSRRSSSKCAYVRIENPKEFSDLEALNDAAEGKFGAMPISRMRKLRLDLKKQGYDGILVRNGSVEENLDLWAAFDRKQVKPATD